MDSRGESEENRTKRAARRRQPLSACRRRHAQARHTYPVHEHRERRTPRRTRQVVAAAAARVADDEFRRAGAADHRAEQRPGCRRGVRVMQHVRADDDVEAPYIIDGRVGDVQDSRREGLLAWWRVAARAASRNASGTASTSVATTCGDETIDEYRDGRPAPRPGSSTVGDLLRSRRDPFGQRRTPGRAGTARRRARRGDPRAPRTPYSAGGPGGPRCGGCRRTGRRSRRGMSSRPCHVLRLGVTARPSTRSGATGARTGRGAVAV